MIYFLIVVSVGGTTTITGPLLAKLLSPADPTNDAPPDESHPGHRDTLTGEEQPGTAGESPRHTATNPQTQRTSDLAGGPGPDTDESARRDSTEPGPDSSGS